MPEKMVYCIQQKGPQVMLCPQGHIRYTRQMEMYVGSIAQGQQLYFFLWVISITVC